MKNLLYTFAFGMAIGFLICFIIFSKKTDTQIEINNEHASIDSDHKVVIKDSKIVKKKENVYQISSDINIEGVGTLSYSRNIKIDPVIDGLYINFGIDQTFGKKYDLFAKVGISHHHRRLLYRLDVGFSPISHDFSLGLGIGFKIF